MNILSEGFECCAVMCRSQFAQGKNTPLLLLDECCNVVEVVGLKQTATSEYGMAQVAGSVHNSNKIHKERDYPRELDHYPGDWKTIFRKSKS